MVSSENDWPGSGSKFRRTTSIISYNICNKLNLTVTTIQDIVLYEQKEKFFQSSSQLSLFARMSVPYWLIQAWPDQNLYPCSCSSFLKNTLESPCILEVLSYPIHMSTKPRNGHVALSKVLNTLSELQLFAVQKGYCISLPFAAWYHRNLFQLSTRNILSSSTN